MPVQHERLTYHIHPKLVNHFQAPEPSSRIRSDEAMIDPPDLLICWVDLIVREDLDGTESKEKWSRLSLHSQKLFLWPQCFPNRNKALQDHQKTQVKRLGQFFGDDMVRWTQKNYPKIASDLHILRDFYFGCSWPNKTLLRQSQQIPRPPRIEIDKLLCF